MIPTAATKSGIDERRHDRGEGGRVAGPADDEHEDQPDVVRLPDRPHRVVGVVARLAVAVVAGRPAATRSPPRSRRRRARRTRPARDDQEQRKASSVIGASPAGSSVKPAGASTARAGSTGPSGARLSRRSTHQTRDRERGVDRRRASRSRPGSPPRPSPPRPCASAVDDPGLAADLRRHPAGDQRHHRGRARRAPPRGRTSATRAAAACAGGRRRRARRAARGGADPDHRLEGEARHVHRRFDGRSGRHRVEPLDGRVRVVVGQEREQARDPIPYRTSSPSYQPRMWIGARVVVVPSPSSAASLAGCFSVDVARDPVADDQLHRRGDRRGRERDRERRPLVAAAAPAQRAPRVAGRRARSR